MEALLVVIHQTEAPAVAERDSPGGMARPGQTGDQPAFDHSDVGDQQRPAIARKRSQNVPPNIGLELIEAGRRTAQTHQSIELDERLLSTPPVVVADLREKRGVFETKRGDLVIEGKAHPDGRLQGTGHGADDDAVERAGGLANLTGKGDTVLIQVRSRSPSWSFFRERMPPDLEDAHPGSHA